MEHDETGSKITSVKTVNSQTGERSEYTAKVFFLCASTLGSTQIMLNSASDKHPRGLSNRSGALGNYLMDHLAVSHTGFFVDDVDSYYQGNRPNGLYVPRFRNLSEQPDEDADFLRGYGYQAVPLRTDWETTFNSKGFGAAYKESLRDPAPFWVWALRAFIECLPNSATEYSCTRTRPIALASRKWRLNSSGATTNVPRFRTVRYRPGEFCGRPVRWVLM